MAADVNRNGSVTSTDTFYILEAAVGLPGPPCPGAGIIGDFDPPERVFCRKRRKFTEPTGGPRAFCWRGLDAAKAESRMSLMSLRAGMIEADWSLTDDEGQLVERARHDREAFTILYRRHFRLLSDHVYRRTGNVHATEDIVSDVFLTALRTLPRFRYRGVPVRFWLLRIATNAVNHWARRRRRHPAVTLPAEELVDAGSYPPATDGQIDLGRTRRALLSLSPKYQAVLSLHYFEGLTVREVAAVIGCRVGTVKSRLARAREALRAKLTP